MILPRKFTVICCLIITIVVIISVLLFRQQNKPADMPINAGQPYGTPVTSISPAPGIKEGEIALDFSFQTIEGKILKLSSLRGQPVLFAFIFTTGCPSCWLEAEQMREAQTQAPFKVIQLAINPRETIEDLRLFREYFGAADWLMSFDTDLAIAKLYDVKKIDTTILVDAVGKILYRDDGYPTESARIIEILKSQ